MTHPSHSISQLEETDRQIRDRGIGFLFLLAANKEGCMQHYMDCPMLLVLSPKGYFSAMSPEFYLETLVTFVATHSVTREDIKLWIGFSKHGESSVTSSIFQKLLRDGLCQRRRVIFSIPQSSFQYPQLVNDRVLSFHSGNARKVSDDRVSTKEMQCLYLICQAT
ncbi:unnamed protein product [Lactuca virosa]|uniref:Uncharacterized protein n=1 Tax=Lactuca virosa TaxID=75947 RepID=A0AAU9NG27_9ASTR|nr:unnamed protein product [Lactuca virosa]